MSASVVAVGLVRFSLPVNLALIREWHSLRICAFLTHP